ncbi:MAG: HRDC domain-containing protein [Nitrospirota bacterium]|nr:HRDC domain-containing protein [Nitrospirota bacterium]
MTELSWQMITTEPALAETAQRLALEPHLAIDLEADSLHHYQESLCLMQISTAHENLLVDLIALDHIDPLLPLLHDARIEKVFHGSDYDVRLLNRQYGVVMENLFDTQVAAQLLGAQNFGLSALLEAHFGVVLDKRFQKKDWSVRPLPPEMLDYAVKDTALLLPLRELLGKAIDEKGRAGWVREECELLSRCRAKPKEAPSCFDIKGAAKLAPEHLAVLQMLVEFRDETARKWDRPPFKVLSSESMMEMATKRPATITELEAIHGVTPRLTARIGKGLLDAIQRGAAMPPEAWPKLARAPRKPRNPLKEKRSEKLEKIRDHKAHELGLPPSLLCNRATLETIANASGPTVAGELLKKWQYGLMGKEFEEVLAGAEGTNGLL